MSFRARKAKPAPETTIFFDDLKPATYKGGEGNQLMLESKTYGYWPESLFALHGRPLPLGPLAIYTFWSTCATALSMLVRLDEAGEPTITLHVHVLGVAGTALFFLLVFRTNASYDRWWEGRKQWGEINAACRNFSRQCIAHITPARDHGSRSEPHAAERVDSLVRWAVAFAVTVKQHLRDDSDIAELKGLVRSVHVRDIAKAAHRPLYVLERMSTELVACQRAGLVDSVEKIAIDMNLGIMTAALGAMERIVRTRMPFAYIVHLRSFLVLWLLALPFTMVIYLQWGGIVACTLIAYSLLGLETIGVEVEQPFGRDYCDLPLDQLTSMLTANLLEALKRYEIVVAAVHGGHGHDRAHGGGADGDAGSANGTPTGERGMRALGFGGGMRSSAETPRPAYQRHKSLVLELK